MLLKILFYIFPIFTLHVAKIATIISIKTSTTFCGICRLISLIHTNSNAFSLLYSAIELKDDAARLIQETVQDKFKIEVTDINGTAAHSILQKKKKKKKKKE
jgi:hypothetical protein